MIYRLPEEHKKVFEEVLDLLHEVTSRYEIATENVLYRSGGIDRNHKLISEAEDAWEQGVEVLRRLRPFSPLEQLADAAE